MPFNPEIEARLKEALPQYSAWGTDFASRIPIEAYEQFTDRDEPYTETADDKALEALTEQVLAAGVTAELLERLNDAYFLVQHRIEEKAFLAGFFVGVATARVMR